MDKEMHKLYFPNMIKFRLFNSLYKPLILLCFLLIACDFSNKKLLPIDVFFNDFEKRIERKNILDIKTVEEDSLGELYYLLKDEIIQSVQLNTKLNEELMIKGIRNNNDKSYVLLVAFHRRLNNRNVRFDELVMELKNSLEAMKDNKEDFEKCIKERLKVAQFNFNNWNLDDTIQLSFPTYFRDNKRNAFTFGCSTSYDSIISSYLFVDGILVSKDTFLNYDNSTELIFKLRVINLSDPNTQILLNKVSVDDTLDINLFNYGRLIE